MFLFLVGKNVAQKNNMYKTNTTKKKAQAGIDWAPEIFGLLPKHFADNA